jgi:hypothetical protein
MPEHCERALPFVLHISMQDWCRAGRLFRTLGCFVCLRVFQVYACIGVNDDRYRPGMEVDATPDHYL